MRRRDVALRQVVSSFHDVEVRRIRPDDSQSDFSLWMEVVEHFRTGDVSRAVFEWRITVLDPRTATVGSLERRSSAAVEAAVEDDPLWWLDDQMVDFEAALVANLAHRGIEVVR